MVHRIFGFVTFLKSNHEVGPQIMVQAIAEQPDENQEITPKEQIPWQLKATAAVPEWLIQTVQDYLGHDQGRCSFRPGQYAAQLLLQRGFSDPTQLSGFLNPDQYHPTSPFAFGAEMARAIERLLQARDQREIVAIWGDFDADGVTATAVLWEGLGQFFEQHRHLLYFIPNRLTESHGLSCSGLDRLAAQGCRLVVTCDTGSTNLAEMTYAQQLGMEVIVTDHHTLPIERPPVTAIINPRYLDPDHPLAHLSGVAVAYKLVEALYERLPTTPTQPLEQLLDLVAIGLIADLVQLTGDCRYLAQRGIQQLQQQANPKTAKRPGLTRLLELCKKSGDRPTDISFGLGPRINAVSRIYGEAQFCVELLTSQDKQKCQQLADAAELANARRKSLQKDVAQQVRQRLSQMDLTNTSVIVLVDHQWPIGILGLVAGQIAQEYGRPTILLNADFQPIGTSDQQTANGAVLLARGSARSVNQIDLYQLVKNQAHLLHRFGGHPFAAGLSLPIANLTLFTDAINRELRQQENSPTTPTPQADLQVRVADLGKDLFRELKLLDPFGMGNPVPRLLIQNCWFENVRHHNLKDFRGRKVRYIKTEFQLRDDSTPQGFPGNWWEHYRDDVPLGRCDAIVELDYNAYQQHYEVRLLAVRTHQPQGQVPEPISSTEIVDRRGHPSAFEDLGLIVTQCPASWLELQTWFRQARQQERTLILAYAPPCDTPPEKIWQQLVGLAKFLSRTQQVATRQQLIQKLGISDRALQSGFKLLGKLGFKVNAQAKGFQITGELSESLQTQETIHYQIEEFISLLKEERFRQQYFYQVPLTVIQFMANQLQGHQR